MNFIDFINKAIAKQEPDKGLYGQILSNYYCLENVAFKELVRITGIGSVNVYSNDKENQLNIDFILRYKDYNLAEISLGFNSPFLFELDGNVKNIAEAIQLLTDELTTVISLEITAENVVVHANNKHVDFQLKTHFKEINIDTVFLNKTSFIGLLENRLKNNQLFHTLCKQISDEQLTTIASVYYGYDAEVFKELKSIRDDENLSKEISFSISDVLSVTRYDKPTTKQGHQERAFAACIIILFLDDSNILFESKDNVLSVLFLSVSAFDISLLEQTRAFFVNLLAKNENEFITLTIAYLILGCDLRLKDETAVNNTFSFLKEMGILEITDFEADTSFTVKRVKEVTLIMLENSNCIKNTSLKKELTTLFSSMIRICEERYEINAINALFERTFTQAQQEVYLTYLPEIQDVPYLDQPKFLREKCLSRQQNLLVMRSLLNARLFVDGSDYEIELKKNIFFDAEVELYKASKNEESLANVALAKK